MILHFWEREFRAYVVGLAAFVITVCVVALWPSTTIATVKACAHFLSGHGNTLYLITGYLTLLVIALKLRLKEELLITVLTFAAVSATVHLVKVSSWSSLLRPSGNSAGYPSGHAAAAFALAFLLSYRLPRLSAFCYLCAISISWSRVIVRAHYPYQVYAGAAFGLLIAILIRQCFTPNAKLQKLAYKAQLLLVSLIPVIAVLADQHEYENNYILFGLGGAIFIFGVILRVWSRQYTLKANADNMPFPTDGPYALTRNPVPIANTLICLGLTIESEIIWLLPLAATMCIIVYALVAREKEETLLRLYGFAYQNYIEEVPRWLPRLSTLRNFHPDTSCLLPAIQREIISLLLIVPVLAKELLSNILPF